MPAGARHAASAAAVQGQVVAPDFEAGGSEVIHLPWAGMHGEHPIAIATVKVVMMVIGLGRLCGVADRTVRFRQALGMWEIVVFGMALTASHRRVGRSK